MQRTKIEWCKNKDMTNGFTGNPIKGQCQHFCDYCYGEKIRQRFGLPKEISWHPEELEKIEKRKKPTTFFMGSIYDLFGSWVLSGAS